jgi:hypothetical protein
VVGQIVPSDHLGISVQPDRRFNVMADILRALALKHDKIKNLCQQMIRTKLRLSGLNSRLTNIDFKQLLEIQGKDDIKFNGCKNGLS